MKITKQFSLENFIRIATLTYLICFIFDLFLSSYYNFSITGSLSFRVNDGWCGSDYPINKGIGQHCFSDFYNSFGYVNDSMPYSSVISIYPPLTLFFLKIFYNLQSLTLNTSFSLLSYLLFAVSTSGFVLFRHLKVLNLHKSIKWNILILILGSGPFIVAFDRGSTNILLFPLIFLTLNSYLQGKIRNFKLLIVVISLFKPQFMLLGLLHLRDRNYKNFFMQFFYVVVGYLLSFALYPVHYLTSIRNWVAYVIQYQNYQPMATLSPVNFSTTNLIYLFTGIKKFIITHEWTAVRIEPGVTSAISILTIATVIFTIVFKSSKLTKNESFLLILLAIILSPGTSFHYYLVILLPTAYFAIIGKNSNFLNKENESSSSTTSKEFYKDFQVLGVSEKIGLLSILVLCPPWTIPFKVLAFRNQLSLPEISAHWLLGQIILILLFASVMFRSNNREKFFELKFSKSKKNR